MIVYDKKADGTRILLQVLDEAEGGSKHSLSESSIVVDTDRALTCVMDYSKGKTIYTIDLFRAGKPVYCAPSVNGTKIVYITDNSWLQKSFHLLPLGSCKIGKQYAIDEISKWK
jgi:hypothetical protein